MTENSVFVCTICPDQTFTSFTELSCHLDSQHEPKSMEINRKMANNNNFASLYGTLKTVPVLNNAYLPKINFNIPGSNQAKCRKIKVIKKSHHSKTLPLADETNIGMSIISKSNNSLDDVKNSAQTSLNGPDELKFKCSDCGKELSTVNNLERHKLVHSVEKNFICEFCGLSFKREDILKDHRCVVNEDGSLARVRRTRHQEEVLDVQATQVCPDCGKSFSNVSNLNRHLKTHGDKMEVCPECGKEFHMKLSLKEHIVQIHNGGKRIDCPVCEKELKGRNSLLTHLLRFHPEQKNRLESPKYACPDCGRVFQQRGNLRKHRLTHSESLNYLCKICKLEFKYPDQLRRHILKHDSKRHVCHMCNRGFTLKYELRNHIDTFHGRMIYVCKFCLTSFKHRQAFNRHLHRQHFDKEEEWKSGGLTFLKSCRIASDHYVNVQIGGQNRSDSPDESSDGQATPPVASTNQLPEANIISDVSYFISDQLEELDDHLASLSSTNGCQNYFNINVDEKIQLQDIADGDLKFGESNHPSFVPHIPDPIGFDAGLMAQTPNNDDQGILMSGSLAEFITFPIPDGIILSPHCSLDGS